MNQTARSPLPRHVFVDYENVNKIEPELIGQAGLVFTILLGAKHTSLPTVMVEKIYQHASSVHLMRLESVGKNALDFLLAFYLGRAATLTPGTRFHVVSRDKGFDPLMAHLSQNGIQVERNENFEFLKSPVAAPAAPKPAPVKPSAPQPASAEPAGFVTRVIEHLKKNEKALPKKRNALTRLVQSSIGKKEPKEAVTKIIEELCTKKIVTIDEKDAVTYELSRAG